MSFCSQNLLYRIYIKTKWVWMMKKNTIAFAAVLLVSMVSLSSCGGTSYKTVKRLQKLEEGVSNPVTKEELQQAIEKYDQRAMDLVAAQAQEGIWYKILGTRYLDERMFGKAMEAFQNALLYYPDNANLYYYVAICAAYQANAQLDFEAQGQSFAHEKMMNYLKVSEDAYLRALSINPKYYRAMYGIGVLYTFQLNESEKAIPYLEKFLETQTKDTNAMFVLARAYYSTYQFQKAIDLYDKIIELNVNPDKTADARTNKNIVLDAQSSH